MKKFSIVAGRSKLSPGTRPPRFPKKRASTENRPGAILARNTGIPGRADRFAVPEPGPPLALSRFVDFTFEALPDLKPRGLEIDLHLRVR